MARLASSTHCTEASIVADGDCSRGRMAEDVLEEGEEGEAGDVAVPPGLSPTGAGVDEDDADCWTAVAAQPKNRNTGRQQSAPQVIMRNRCGCGMFPFRAIMGTLPPAAQRPETWTHPGKLSAVWKWSSPEPRPCCAASKTSWARYRR
jgi:hypothetical protein